MFEFFVASSPHRHYSRIFVLRILLFVHVKKIFGYANRWAIVNICLSTIKDHPLYVNNEIKRFTFIQTIRTGNVVIKTKILSISLQCISIPIEYYVVGKENGHFYCSHLIFMPFRIGSNKTGTVISLSAGDTGKYDWTSKQPQFVFAPRERGKECI